MIRSLLFILTCISFSIALAEETKGIFFEIQSLKNKCVLSGFSHARFEERNKKPPSKLEKIVDEADVVFVESVKQSGFEYLPDIGKNYMQSNRKLTYSEGYIDEQIRALDARFYEANTGVKDSFGLLTWSGGQDFLRQVPLHTVAESLVTTARALRLSKTYPNYNVFTGFDQLAIKMALNKNKIIFGLENSMLHINIWEGLTNREMKKNYLIDSYRLTIEKDTLAHLNKISHAIDNGSLIEFDKSY